MKTMVLRLLVTTIVSMMLANTASALELSLPKTASVKPGRLLKLTVTTDAKSVRWIGPYDDVDLIESESAKWIIFLATRPGKYTIHVVGADATGNLAYACCLVTVQGDVPPSPPDPGPGPGPAPPPSDPLVASLQAAYIVDTAAAADKQKMVQALADLYSAAAKHVQDKATVKTVSDMRSDLTAGSSGLNKALLVELRRVIATTVAGAMPSNGATVLTDQLRTTATQVFNRISTALRAVK